ncbi:MAG TPA: hypothetical protein DDW94_10125 [Deltaproteobacteria bacterium]|nr:MAG: hypothetical protein A2Z79_12720 [Deltaproteobacteria bacterium GWA2_55_82]OGQ63739.1 MAG: hypothetical protein A3I81_12235 [Deltaproteobacteria bacterium RIFCSPLOWO2_02_FULL_55_12]OIJ73462.1 MAG: hypothetical protein A2V21_303790 [Deltaproteobacteria bacterium GWC2_55_46]HBG47328.1 hypothetical protein [Deltaproteobacteria bacterium]HCY10094.1 hypothetical protein [Deltaproteobacteria bacterium]
MKLLLRSKLLVLLLPVWIGGSIALFRAEWEGVRFAYLLQTEPAVRDAATVKPIDRFAIKAEELIPRGSKVFFFNPFPPRSSRGGFYEMRIKYQLYQRKLALVSFDREFDPAAIKNGDYLLFITPTDTPNTLESDFRERLPLKELYSWQDPGGVMSIYQTEADW